MIQQLKDQYDWVVLGDHPAAYLTAGLAARLGLSVIVLNPFPGARRQFLREYSREFDPEPNLALGWSTDPAVPSLFPSVLDGASEKRHRLVVDPVEPHVLDQQIRLRLRKDPARLAQALQREVGQSWPELNELVEIQERPEPSVLERWLKQEGDLSAKLRAWGSRGFKTWLAQNQSEQKKADQRIGGAGFWGQQEFHHLAPQLERIVRGWQFGVLQASHEFASPAMALEAVRLLPWMGQVDGGVDSLRRYLRGAAESWGAVFTEHWECQRIFASDQRLSAIQVAQTTEAKTKTFGVKAGILGCSVDHVIGFLEGLRPGERRHQLKEAPRVGAWWFSVLLEVNAAAIPPGASSRMVWSELDGSPVLFELEPVRSGVKSKKEDRISLYVRCLLPYENESLEPRFHRKVIGRLKRTAMEVFPFLEEHDVFMVPDVSQRVEAIHSVYGFAAPELIPENLRIYSGKGLGFESGIAGLYLATGECYPEWGQLGPWIAATESLGNFLNQTSPG